MTRRGFPWLLLVVLVAVLGCKQTLKPLPLNNRAADNNRKIAKAATAMRQKLAPLAAGREVKGPEARQATEDVKAVIADARSDMNKVGPNYLPEASDFYYTHLKYLDAIDRIAQQEFPRIVQAVEQKGQTPQEKWAAVSGILNRIEKSAADELTKLKSAQQAFASPGKFTIGGGGMGPGGPMGPR